MNVANCVIPGCIASCMAQNYPYCSDYHESLDKNRYHASCLGLYCVNKCWGPPWPHDSSIFVDDHYDCGDDVIPNFCDEPYETIPIIENTSLVTPVIQNKVSDIKDDKFCAPSHIKQNSIQIDKYERILVSKNSHRTSEHPNTSKRTFSRVEKIEPYFEKNSNSHDLLESIDNFDDDDHEDNNSGRCPTKTSHVLPSVPSASGNQSVLPSPPWESIQKYNRTNTGRIYTAGRLEVAPLKLSNVQFSKKSKQLKLDGSLFNTSKSKQVPRHNYK